jgi:hypothetical protein
MLLLFAPLALIGLALTAPESALPAGQNAELGVGLAVIVRATARRLLRAGVQNLLRTSLGTFTRTAARTVTRRMTRLAIRQMTGLLFASLVRDAAGKEFEPATPRATTIALVTGFAALWASFRGILLLIGAERAGPLLGGLSPAAASAIIAAPMLIHALFTWLAARVSGVEIAFQTQLDGLLLQGYFTGAGAFLPLTTDVEYRGTSAGQARTAALALAGLLGLHIALNLAGRMLSIYPLTFASAAVLMYAFVFAFPLPPLEGHRLWRRSKLLWLAIWAPTLAAFLVNIPEAFSEIL